MNERDMRRFFGTVSRKTSRKRRKCSIVANVMWFCAVVAIAGFFFDYSLMTIFAKDIPWYADCIVGLVTCPITVPVGLLCWVAVLCDVGTPFVPGTPPAAEAPMDPTNG